jgi:hypothetical protein
MNKKFTKSICAISAIYLLVLFWTGANPLLAQGPSQTLAPVQIPEVVKPGIGEQLMNFIYAIDWYIIDSRVGTLYYYFSGKDSMMVYATVNLFFSTSQSNGSEYPADRVGHFIWNK